MRKAVALKYFRSASRIARLLDISRAAVSQWNDVVPEGSAYKLQALSGGKCRVDPACYSREVVRHAAQSVSGI